MPRNRSSATRLPVIRLSCSVQRALTAEGPSARSNRMACYSAYPKTLRIPPSSGPSTPAIVAFYTDGVLEAKNAAQQEFGTAGCLKFLGSQSNLAAAPLLTAFVDALTQWSGTTDGGGHEDDITLVVVDFERQSV